MRHIGTFKVKSLEFEMYLYVRFEILLHFRIEETSLHYPKIRLAPAIDFSGGEIPKEDLEKMTFFFCKVFTFVNGTSTVYRRRYVDRIDCRNSTLRVPGR